MSLKSTANPQVIAKFKVDRFDGVAGPEDRILIRKSEDGRIYSNSLANQIYDLDLKIKGRAELRPGCRKIYDVGYDDDVSGIFSISLNRKASYGVVIGGSLTIIDMIEDFGSRKDFIELDPATVFDTLTNEYVPASVGEPLL